MIGTSGTMIAITSSTTLRAFTGRVPTTRARRILTPTDIGPRCPTTDPSGFLRYLWTGFRIATAAGFGSRITVGHGFRMSRGAGLRTTTGAGSIRARRGYGGQDRWAATDAGLDMAAATIDRSGLRRTFHSSGSAVASA